MRYHTVLKPLISDDKTNIILRLDLPPPYLVKQALLLCSKPDYKTDVTSLYVSPKKFDLEEAGIDEAFPNLVEFCIDCFDRGLPVRLLTSLPKLESLKVTGSSWPETLVLPNEHKQTSHKHARTSSLYACLASYVCTC